MSWNRVILRMLLVGISYLWMQSVIAAQVCPVRQDQTLRFIDVFDGSPEEHAKLIPDRANDESGYWKLGYVYKAGRFVTIRCKYADGKEVDVKLPKKVDRCQYKLDARKTLNVACK